MRSLIPSSPRKGSRTKAWSIKKLYLPVLCCAIIGSLSLSSHAVSAACNFLLKWGASGDGPRGIVVASDGNVFVANSNPNIQKRSPTGTLLLSFGTGGASAGAIISASGVAVNNSSGDVYVTDSDPDRSNTMVQRFNSSGTFVNAWGTQGGGNGQFQSPGGVAVDSAGSVYVADSGNHRIQKFTAAGVFTTKWAATARATASLVGHRESPLTL